MRFKLVFISIIGVGLLAGCDNGFQGEFDPPPPEVGQVVMSIPVDTLWYPAGEPVQTAVSVTVRDFAGNKMPGQSVTVFTDNPQLGILEYLDPMLRDKTNAEGIVELRFISLRIPGKTVLTASAGGFGTRDSLICKAVQTEWLDSLWIETQTDTLWFSQGESAVTPLTVFALNTEGNPMAGLEVEIGLENPQLGEIVFADDSLQNTTDSLGQVQLYFRSNATEGNAIITASAEEVTVSDTLLCRKLPNLIWVNIDYVTGYRFGQVVLFNMYFRALYTTAHGLPLTGAFLEANTTMGSVSYDLPLTNEFGITSGSVFGEREAGEACVTVTDGVVVDTACRTFTSNQ